MGACRAFVNTEPQHNTLVYMWLPAPVPVAQGSLVSEICRRLPEC